MDDHTFYFRAGNEICSSLDLETALHRFFLILEESMPADAISLHLFDPGFGFIESLAVASDDGGQPLSEITPLPKEIRKAIEAFIASLDGTPYCQRLDRMGDDPLAALAAEKLGVEDYSGMILDLILEGQYLGILTVGNSSGKTFTQDHADKLLMVHNPLALACAGFIRHRDLTELKDRLTRDYQYLQRDLIRKSGDKVIGADQGLKPVMNLVHKVAPTTSPVLLLGETGVGKGVIAQAIHRLSSRSEQPLIVVDCAAIPDNLVESDLFGHEKGAFTGALSKHIGRFERAHQGTIFLDEIGELPLATQKKILRVLQDGVIERIGGTQTIRPDIRVIAATHRPLDKMVKQGRFRKDLFFRLNVFPITIPPLRERKTDIQLLANDIIKRQSRRMGLPHIVTLSPGAGDILAAYSWPGNVRELKNIIERELIIKGNDPLLFDTLLSALSKRPEKKEKYDLGLDKAMREHIQNVVDMTNGRVEGPKGAGILLGVHPRTLQHRMKKLGVEFGRGYKKKTAG